MRTLCWASVLLLICAAESTGHADGVRSTYTRPTCKCPSAVYHSGFYRHYRPRSYVGRYREWPPYAAVTPAPDLYNPWLPGTWDTAHDRAMTLHFRSPAVSGIYRAELGWPPTPPVHGLFPYRVKAWGAVYQYDGLIGQYVELARPDAGGRRGRSASSALVAGLAFGSVVAVTSSVARSVEFHKVLLEPLCRCC